MKKIKTSQFKTNPKNPRTITEEQYEKLKKSIVEFPKTMSLRPIIYNPDTKIVLGGNQRLLAVQELYEEAPEDWFKSAKDLTEEEVQRFIIVDNVPFGNWDMSILEQEFDTSMLQDWGLELFENFDGNIDDFFTDENKGGGNNGDTDKNADSNIVTCPHCGESFSLDKK